MREPYLVKRLQTRLDPGRPDANVVALYNWSNAFVHFGTQQAFSLVDDLTEPEDGQSGLKKDYGVGCQRQLDTFGPEGSG